MSMIFKMVKFISIVLLVVPIMACSDSNEENNESIIGFWTWYETSGGIGGIVETPNTTGETREVLFNEDGNVEFYTNDEVTFSSTYTLSNESTIFSDEELPVVIVEGLDFNYVYSFPYVDELELQEAVTDGFIHNYRKD